MVKELIVSPSKYTFKKPMMPPNCSDVCVEEREKAQWAEATWRKRGVESGVSGRVSQGGQGQGRDASEKQE
jgi:hypothetical protein